MRKVVLIIAIVISLYICTACQSLLNLDGTSVLMVDAGDDVALKVINCFKTKDEEALKNLFCDISMESDTLMDEIQIAMDFLEGEIVSYDENIIGGETTSYEDGKITKQRVSPFIDDITTNEDKVYSIKIYCYTVYDEQPEKVGISQVDIESEEGNKTSIGMCIK